MLVDVELRKAAAYISAGKNEVARSILSKYLNDFPESDLAWLLLSYVIDEPRKKLASVSRALRLNPQNTQAKDRHDQLMLEASEQPHQKATSTGRISFDWSSPPFHSLPNSNDRPTQPFSIEERLAFDSIEAETTRRHNLAEYPAESFLRDRVHDRDVSGRVRKKRPRKLKLLLLGGVTFITLIAATIVAVMFFTGGFISKEDAQATASVETAIALATNEARGRLPPTWTPTITPTYTDTPMPSATPMPTATATIEQPNPTVVAEIEILEQQVSDLRELNILQHVDTYLVLRPRVRSLLENYYFTQVGTEEEILDTGRVLTALGLIDPNYDLQSDMLNSLTDSVGGFYLHESNQIFVVGYRFTGVEKFIYSHEYGHALVDQNFDISGLKVYPRCEGNEDRCKAIQALLEGDATLLMTQWLTQVATASEFEEVQNYRPPRGILPDHEPPPFAARNSEFPYTNGLEFVQALYAQGGWSRVDQGYVDLPSSTEQILHPGKYFSGEGPISVSAVPLREILDADWRLLANNTLGEWLTYLLLSYSVDPAAQVDEATATLASQGWGGDNYQIYYNDGTGETVLVVHWVWDQAGDTTEFANAMRVYQQGRFSGEDVVGSNGECVQGEYRVSCFYQTSHETLWIVAPTMDLLQSVENLYPAFY